MGQNISNPFAGAALATAAQGIGSTVTESGAAVGQAVGSVWG